MLFFRAFRMLSVVSNVDKYNRTSPPAGIIRLRKNRTFFGFPVIFPKYTLYMRTERKENVRGTFLAKWPGCGLVKYHFFPFLA